MYWKSINVAWFAGIVLMATGCVEKDWPEGKPWARHTIDSSRKKSEGIRLGDVNRDGLTDLAVGWESEDESVLYLNPGSEKAKKRWPGMAVGTTPQVEDAALFDVDNDGVLDIVSSLEEDADRVMVHWGPEPGRSLLDRDSWVQDEFTQVSGVSLWMYSEAIHLLPSRPIDLVIGGKNEEADCGSWVGLLMASSKRRDAAAWSWRPLVSISWVMSIVAADLDEDGYQDILYSDKHGTKAGVWWLRNPGGEHPKDDPWAAERLTPAEVESANFLTVTDLDMDGQQDILALVELSRQPGAPDHAHRRIYYMRNSGGPPATWQTHEIHIPPGIAQSKGITTGDINGDGRVDIVITSTGAEGRLIGTSWLEQGESVFASDWKAHNISGAPGTKYDLVHLMDLDGDGDLDVLANEEKYHLFGLGVFWYENPYSP